MGWRFQPHCRITRPSSCSESIKQPPAAASRRQIYDALICRNGKARMEVSPYSTSLPVGSYRLILSKLHTAIMNRGYRIYETAPTFYNLIHEYHHLNLLIFKVSLTFKLDKHRYKDSLNLSFMKRPCDKHIFL